MNYPSLLIEFDPVTWEPTAVYFKSSSDEETKRLQEILNQGLKTEILIPAGEHYDA